jgi:hypothetical protein
MTKPRRSDLRFLVEQLNAFQKSLRPVAAATVTTPPPGRSVPPAREADIVRRLGKVSPELAVSFQQVLGDLDDPSRVTYMGPVGEAREVLRAAIHALAPDEDVKAQPWFKGDDKGRPTQAERARYAAGRRSNRDADEAADAIDVFEEKLGRLFRTVYTSASKRFHTSTQRSEAQRIVGYAVVILDDVLPD